MRIGFSRGGFMGRYFLFFSFFVFASGTLSASASAEDLESSSGLKHCFESLLGPDKESLTLAEMKSLIESDLGGGPYPAELHRDFIRDGKVLVSLVIGVYGNFERKSRRAYIHVKDLTNTEIKLKEFFDIVSKDLKELDDGTYSRSPDTVDVDQKIGGTPRILFIASSVTQHPSDLMTLFDLGTYILGQRLANVTVVDRISVRRLPNPEKVF